MSNFISLSCPNCGGPLKEYQGLTDYICDFCGSVIHRTFSIKKDIIGISCSVLNCQNPVIGQCIGYEKECHNFYCATHSKDNLCFECFTHKSQDDHNKWLVSEYQRQISLLQDNLSRKSWSTSRIVIFIIGVIGVLLSAGLFNSNNTIAGFLLTISFIAIFIIIIWNSTVRHENEEVASKQIDKILTGFYDYYKNWKEEKTKHAWSVVGQVFLWVFFFAIMIIAAGISSDSDRNRNN